MKRNSIRNALENSHENHVVDSYIQILSSVALADPEDNIEIYLAEAFELGRSAVDQMIPPDDLINIHHMGVMALANSHVDLSLIQVAERLTRPLMEMSMAYGLAFRQQMESRYEGIVNARLEESRKLEAIGTLAAGIGHDFNNLLGSIVGFAEMAGDDFADDTPGKYNIQQILNASFRARDLVTRMLTFARQGPVKLIAVDVVSEVCEAIALLRASLRPSVQIDFSSDLEKATILADISQVQQIVMNLCINAADAMNQRGKIVIRLEPDAIQAKDGQITQWICLYISDNGAGISPELVDRIFDPFFTTKAPGKGSGLGLSVVYGIVTGLQGNIHVNSSSRGQKQGTQFKIILPLIKADKIGNED